MHENREDYNHRGKDPKTQKPPTTVKPKHIATVRRKKTWLTTSRNPNSHVLSSLRTRNNLHHLQGNRNPQHLHHATTGRAPHDSATATREKTRQQKKSHHFRGNQPKPSIRLPKPSPQGQAKAVFLTTTPKDLTTRAATSDRPTRGESISGIAEGEDKKEYTKNKERKRMVRESIRDRQNSKINLLNEI
ncbi:unnamed protein product [Brassica oleracea]|uniref:(rape) hypothetical protein n=1 Tax=Brassica napus TaxID=3708 RepID=A0A816JFP4_BRANA|nr:unnamed protein product [Brassica napus]